MAFGPKSKKNRAFIKRQAAFFSQKFGFKGAQDMANHFEKTPSGRIYSIDFGSKKADEAGVLVFLAGYRPQPNP